MKRLGAFALVLLAGIIFLVLGLTVLSNGWASFVARGKANPTGYVPGCNPGYSGGCVTWPYVGWALICIGAVVALVGSAGLLEIVLPRGEV